MGVRSDFWVWRAEFLHTAHMKFILKSISKQIVLSNVMSILSREKATG
jgi:hypothetical protein